MTVISVINKFVVTIFHYKLLQYRNSSLCFLCFSKYSKYKKENNIFLDKIALITGGAKGIGRAVMRQLLLQNVGGVAMIDVCKHRGVKTMQELCADFGGNKLFFMHCDVTCIDWFDLAFKRTIEQFRHIDIVINCAGIMNDFDWQKQVNVNLGGCVTGSLLGMQYMAKSNCSSGGIVVNVSSIIGLLPSAGLPIHTMTQHGIIGFSRSLGSHFPRTGVKVIAFCPGLTNTQLMNDASSNTINNKFKETFVEEVGNCEFQSPTCVAKDLITVMRVAQSGSVWASEKYEEPYQVSFPTIMELKSNKV